MKVLPALLFSIRGEKYDNQHRKSADQKSDPASEEEQAASGTGNLYYRRNQNVPGSTDRPGNKDLCIRKFLQKTSDTKTPQGVLSLVKRFEYDLDDIIQGSTPLIMVLENIQDPGNLGTIVRTGEGAGITGVIMSNGTVDIYNPKTIRATMGSIYRVPFCYAENMQEVMQKLKKCKIQTYAAYLEGSSVHDAQNYKEATAFLIGNEGNGLTRELAESADWRIRIPMCGKVESLNAGIASAILMYEAQRQRRN